MSSFVENINIVAGVTGLQNVADNIEAVKITADNIEAVQDVSENMADVNTVADNMADVTLVADNMADVLETELRAWEAEASQLTANSYATEPEGTLVKQYTSNGDGTFTVTDTTEYSSLHWSDRAYDLVTEGVIDDTRVLLDRTYSSSKIMQLHTSTAQAIANLSTAQGQLVNTNTPVFEEIPIAPVVGVLDFTVTSQSTDYLIFELNDADNLITFKQETSYSFISSVTLKSSVAGSREVTFNIVDNDTNNVITTESMVVTIPVGDNETFTLSTLIQAPSYPVTVRIEVMCSGGGYKLKHFSSILISQGGNISSGLIDYDNTSSGLTAELVQGAIDELAISDVTLKGTKTFTSSPIVPTPTADTQAATKEYVDDLRIGLIDYGYVAKSYHIVAFGGEFNRADYPKLWAYIQSKSFLKSDAEWQDEATANNGICGFYSAGNGTTTFRVPSLDKAFLRSDSRAVGSFQGDAIRNITGAIPPYDPGTLPVGVSQGAFSTIAGGGNVPIGAEGVRNYQTFDASRVVPTADENRPKNIAVLPLIVAK